MLAEAVTVIVASSEPLVGETVSQDDSLLTVQSQLESIEKSISPPDDVKFKELFDSDSDRIVSGSTFGVLLHPAFISETNNTMNAFVIIEKVFLLNNNFFMIQSTPNINNLLKCQSKTRSISGSYKIDTRKAVAIHCRLAFELITMIFIHIFSMS